MTRGYQDLKVFSFLAKAVLAGIPQFPFIISSFFVGDFLVSMHLCVIITVCNTVPVHVLDIMVVMSYNNMSFLPLCVVGGREAEEGAATSVNCAVNPELNTQQAHHYIDCRATASSRVSR